MSEYLEIGKFEMTVGKSGSGKTLCFMVPEILKTIKENKSFIVTDAKNEVLDYIGEELSSNHYEVVNLNLRDLSNSVSWNPLYMPFDAYKNNDIAKCYFLLNCMAQSLFNQGQDSKSDPYWILSARDLFIGLALALFEDATSVNQINMCSIYSMAMAAHDRVGSSNYLCEYIESKKNERNRAVSCAYGVVKAPSDTRLSILSVFHQKLRMLTMNDRNNTILCNDSIDLSEKLKRKTAFIIQYEDEIDESSFLANVYISQLINLLVHERAKGDRKYQEFSVFFEDFLLLGYFPELSHMIQACKSRKINLYFSLNDLSLMENVYGKNITQALLDNCDKLVWTSIKSREALKYLKMLCGEGFSAEKIGTQELLEIVDHSIVNVKDKEYAAPCERSERIMFATGVNYAEREIAIFSIKEYVDKYREMRLDEMLRRLPEPTGSFEDIIEMMDKRIEEIETQDKGDRK